MTYSNILELYRDQQEEREEAQERYEREHGVDDIIPNDVHLTVEQSASMSAAVAKIQADLRAEYHWLFKGGC